MSTATAAGSLTETKEQWPDNMYWKNRALRQGITHLAPGKTYEVNDTRSLHTIQVTLYRLAKRQGVPIETCKANGKILIRLVAKESA